MFLNCNAITDELPNIQLSLTTVRDASLPGIQTYFIYSLRMIGKPVIDLQRIVWFFKTNLAYIRYGFPGKAKAFKANLASVRLRRQDLRLIMSETLVTDYNNINPRKARFFKDLSRKRHVCVANITVTGLTNFVRHGCLTIAGFTNTILIFSNFKITFCTSL